MVTPEEILAPASKTILVVDDTEENVAILLGLLEDYDVLVALDGESALEMVKEEAIDLILLDIVMPGIDGYETCKQLKRDPETASIPVVFITAKTDEVSIEQAYEVGGADYVTKPFKPLEVMARVKNQLKVQALISYLGRLSSFDAMTDLYNRRKFFEKGEQRFSSRGQTLYAAMIDIDKFKHINDSYGHPTGDRAIKAMADVLRHQLQSPAEEGDVEDSEQLLIGRLGGEEFALLGDFDEESDAIQRLEALRLAASEIRIATDDGVHIGFTVSVGIAWAGPQLHSLDEVLKAADEGLYEAKGGGRNQSVFRT